MKLRLEKETVKLRLSPQEINILKSARCINEEIYISENNSMSYAIEINEELGSCLVKIENNSLTVAIPGEKANKWLNSNQIGIKESILTDRGDAISLFIEEDLPPRRNKDKKQIEPNATD